MPRERLAIRCSFLWAASVLCLLAGGCKPSSPDDDPLAPVESTPAVQPGRITNQPTPEDSPGIATGEVTKVCSAPQFRECHESLSLEHVYTNGAAGEELMVESTGGGVAWVDFDRDGHIDLYLNQGGSPRQADLSSNPSDQLFRNLGGTEFRNVTVSALIEERGYSQGVAAGDFDNDGFVDIYVTNVGANRLFRNLGDGTFLEVSEKAGVDDPRWSSSAAWADLDGDGNLDLYVCNYLRFDPDNPVICRHANGQPGMCDPHQVEAWPDEFYLNQGDGTFRACASELGLKGEGNKALGVAIADFNNDQKLDIYICNDTTDNFLFLQQSSFGFLEQAQPKGCAVSGYGEAQASMGVAVSDFNRDGLPDLYVTHFTRESNTLYRNLGEAGFGDVTSITGLHTPTLHHLGFGVVMADFNRDGHDDVFIANGHIDDWSPHNEDFEQTPQLFSFDGNRWHETGPQAGSIFSEKFVARGVAAADFDSDGDLDLACVRQNKTALILENQASSGEWLRLRFIGKRNNRDGIGVCVKVMSADQTTLTQQLCGGTSYCSSHEPVLTFGAVTGPLNIEIRWPNGLIQHLVGVPTNQLITAIEEPAG